MDSTGDGDDVAPGDGTCADAGDNCTLRAAIMESNALAAGAPHTIAFNVGGGGGQTISPGSALPMITRPVTIDGTTQPGCATYPCIELDGSGAGALVIGLEIVAGSSTVRGLVIHSFGAVGVALRLGGGNFIEGNYIGTDVTGTVDLGNSAHGVIIWSAPSNTIGGTTAAQRNVISGNDQFGVYILGNAATGNQVQGNFIGTDATGTADLGNSNEGVVISGAAGNTIGGTLAGAGNVISGNDWSGVYIVGNGAMGNQVQGNRIGTDAGGTADLGNSWDGVRIQDAPGNTIGGTAAGAGNTIAFNVLDGVYVISGTGNPVLSNAIFSNGGLGVDLGPGGVTANDSGDPDWGANDLQNFPVLVSATSSGATIIQGTLNSVAATGFTLQFFSNAACDPSNYGEGQTYLGSLNVTTDGSGNVNFTANLPVAVPAGQFVTATATDPNDNTSEFCQCVLVKAPPSPAEEDERAPAPAPTPTPPPQAREFNCWPWLIIVPPGAAPNAVPGEWYQASLGQPLPAQSAFRYLGHSTEVTICDAAGVAITQFTQPIKVCFRYTQPELDAVGGDPADFLLQVLRDGKWQALDTRPEGSLSHPGVCAPVDHLTLFALFARDGATMEASAAAASDSTLVFPTHLPETGAPPGAWPLVVVGLWLVLAGGALFKKGL